VTWVRVVGRCLYKALDSDQERGHASHKLPPPPYISHTNSTFLRFASGSNPSPTLPKPRPCLVANPHQLPPGNSAFDRLSAASSLLQTHSSIPAVDHPQAFMAEQLESARTSLAQTPRTSQTSPRTRCQD